MSVQVTSSKTHQGFQDLTTDWHCHLLPALDDGPFFIEESVGMARNLCSAGYRSVCCTPHLIKGNYEASNDVVRRAVAALQQELNSRQVDLQLLPGREYYLDKPIVEQLQEPLPLGNSRYILIEIPNHAPVVFIKEVCYRIKCNGYTPLIAHPERSRLLQLDYSTEPRQGFWSSLFRTQQISTCQAEPSNALLDYLKEIDCRFQGNVGSFAGFYGETVRRQALALRERGLYDCFGSDGHRAAHLEDILIHGIPHLNP